MDFVMMIIVVVGGLMLGGGMLGGWLYHKLHADPTDGRTPEDPAGTLSERMARMEREVSELRGQLLALRATSPDPAVAQTLAEVAADPASPQPPLPAGHPQNTPAVSEPSAAQIDAAIPPQPAPAAAAPAAPREVHAPETLEPAEPNFIVKWFLDGNTVVRVGVVILFFGVAFLLKYAYEHTHVPIELRLAGVGLGGIVLLALGWRLRTRRQGYALALQGGAIGLLYLTIFAAFRLYGVLPPGPAFVLLLAMALFSAVLAVAQDSLALAALGVSGGFLAPLLASTGSGSHVMLFSYYLVLNLSIAAIAWHKAWRVLNLLGFGFTFVVGLAWGSKFYRPEFFASVEPFLVLHFLLYVLIPLLFARSRSMDLKSHVDGTLVFGVPLIAFGMQTGLVKSYEYGAAWSALALAFFYLGLATLLWRRAGDSLRLLVESWLALGVAFATLAIPLAFEGRLTSAAWALEGAAIVWIGTRQGRALARACGILLQVAAGIAFLSDSRGAAAAVPVLNSHYLGMVFMAAGGLFCAAWLHVNKDRIREWERLASDLLLGWSFLWWSAGGLHEIRAHLPAAVHAHAALLFLAASAFGYSLLRRRLDWDLARLPGYAIVPLMALALSYDIGLRVHPLADLGWLTWPICFALHLAMLRRGEQETLGQTGNDILDAWHAAGVLLLAAIGSWEIGWRVDELVDGGRVWPLIAWALVPAAMLALMTTQTARSVWPLARHPKAYLVAAATPLALFLAGWTLYANFTHNGNPAPLPYLPLLNPLDVAQFGVFVLIAHWLMGIRRLGLAPALFAAPGLLYAALGAGGFIWANGVLLRTLHHWADVPFNLDLMLRSMLVQACLSIFWTVLALLLMLLAAKKAIRPLWMAGAALMGVVVAKLFMIDLSHVGGVERIVSFIGVGVLMLVIGYFAPVPPSDQVKSA